MLSSLFHFLRICLRIVFKNLFLRRDHFMISLVIVLLMQGAWFTLTYAFFQRRILLNSNFFSPTRAEMKKCISEIIYKSFIWKFFVTSTLRKMWFLFSVKNVQYSQTHFLNLR